MRARLARKAAFRKALRRLHTIGDGVYELATDDTVVCRCEEVTRGRAVRGGRRDDRPERREEPHPRGHGSLPGEELPAPGRRDDRRPARHSDRVRPAGDAALPGAAGADGRDRRLDDRGRRAVLLSDSATPTAAGLDRRARRRRRPHRHGARVLPRRRGRRRRGRRARRAEPRGLRNERGQLPLPDRDPPPHGLRDGERRAAGCSRRCGCCGRRPGCGRRSSTSSTAPSTST